MTNADLFFMMPSIVFRPVAAYDVNSDVRVLLLLTRVGCAVALSTYLTVIIFFS